MSRGISIDQMANEISRMMSDYGNAESDIVKEACKETAKEAVKKLKKDSPKDTGKYAKGWKMKVQFENSNEVRIAIHNSEYFLTHLLEYGHAKRNGGRVAGQTHIKPIEEWLQEEVERRIRE